VNEPGKKAMSPTKQDDDSHDGIRWSAAVSTFVSASSCDPALAAFLVQFCKAHPQDIIQRLSPELAQHQKRETTAFLVSAIKHAVGDHVLSDREVQELRHVSRLLRVEEGEVLAHHRDDVSQFLGQELERLFEDMRIDPAEAIHKVKLQELLGLSYDEFLSLTASQTEAVLLRLLRRLEADAVAGGIRLSISRFQQAATALDTLVRLDVETEVREENDRSGYVYLLVNPAMPGMVKIGRTRRPPATRVAELSGATGVPVPFVLLYDVRVPDAVAGEQYIHRSLEERGARVAGNREFFDVSPSVAVELLLQMRDAIERSVVPYSK
jgi:hypothetical protein